MFVSSTVIVVYFSGVVNTRVIAFTVLDTALAFFLSVNSVGLPVPPSIDAIVTSVGL